MYLFNFQSILVKILNFLKNAQSESLHIFAKVKNFHLLTITIFFFCSRITSKYKQKVTFNFSLI